MQHCDNDMVDICSVLLSLETEHNIFEWNPKIDQDLSETGSSNQQMKGCEDGQSHGEKVAKKKISSCDSFSSSGASFYRAWQL